MVIHAEEHELIAEPKTLLHNLPALIGVPVSDVWFRSMQEMEGLILMSVNGQEAQRIRDLSDGTSLNVGASRCTAAWSTGYLGSDPHCRCRFTWTETSV
jgi:hypothetical protein